MTRPGRRGPGALDAGQGAFLVRGDMVGLVALDFVLRRIWARPPGMAKGLFPFRASPRQALPEKLTMGGKTRLTGRRAVILRKRAATLVCRRVVNYGALGADSHEMATGPKRRWSIWVSGNWRITFEFQAGHAFVLDYEDYH